ncbi:hypothetical protein E2C01_037607 [Portunus trituberculatus]|uniref:Uncharacterized protein n=1 Tax=Portunus trituberculatus TaxID=210409 RepID=A0A5B7FFE0_PORTR|nr:hypothetical protein [Portunus trituberculatus]
MTGQRICLNDKPVNCWSQLSPSVLADPAGRPRTLHCDSIIFDVVFKRGEAALCSVPCYRPSSGKGDTSVLLDINQSRNRPALARLSCLRVEGMTLH